MIETEQMGKMIVVAPSTGGNNPNNTDMGIINMLRPDLATNTGIGTGAFEDYFFPRFDSTH